MTATGIDAETVKPCLQNKIQRRCAENNAEQRSDDQRKRRQLAQMS